MTAKTRMQSSRVITVHCSGRLGRGDVCPGGCVCPVGGGCLPKGGVCPRECLPGGGVYTPLWTEFLTNACENITFPQTTADGHYYDIVTQNRTVRCSNVVFTDTCAMQFHFQYCGVKIKQKYSWKAESDFQPHSVCIVGDSLFVQDYLTHSVCAFKIYNLKDGSLVVTRRLPCRHSPSLGSFFQYDDGREQKWILEGCYTCAALRLHDVERNKVPVVAQHLQPLEICA